MNLKERFAGIMDWHDAILDCPFHVRLVYGFLIAWCPKILLKKIKKIGWNEYYNRTSMLRNTKGDDK
jgi:hypothetical protein